MAVTVAVTRGICKEEVQFLLRVTAKAYCQGWAVAYKLHKLTLAVTRVVFLDLLVAATESYCQANYQDRSCPWQLAWQ